MMKVEFINQQDALRWIAAQARNDAHLNILKMDLEFNNIVSGLFFIDLLEVSYAIATTSS